MLTIQQNSTYIFEHYPQSNNSRRERSPEGNRRSSTRTCELLAVWRKEITVFCTTPSYIGDSPKGLRERNRRKDCWPYAQNRQERIDYEYCLLWKLSRGIAFARWILLYFTSFSVQETWRLTNLAWKIALSGFPVDWVRVWSSLLSIEEQAIGVYYYTGPHLHPERHEYPCPRLDVTNWH